MDRIEKELLKQISDLEAIPKGAYSIRKNGETYKRNCTEEIQIVPKTNKQGINIFVESNTKGKSVHIPVIITQSGLTDLVFNDFYIGENCEITIIAGCGIHNCTNKLSQHNGIHTFHIGKNSVVKYVEKHLGLGNENSERVLNPTTKIFVEDGGQLTMETLQLGGVSNANRKTFAKLKNNAKLVVKESILTEQNQVAKTFFKVSLVGKKSFCNVTSRAVAKNYSKQKFVSKLIGKNECFGHVECDGILLDNAFVSSCPEVDAQSTESTLIHEAAIGKIAGDQIVKLKTLGLSQEQAEKEIINSFMM